MITLEDEEWTEFKVLARIAIENIRAMASSLERLIA